MSLTNVTLIMSMAFLTSCAVNHHYDPEKAHHTKSGFKNTAPVADKGFLDFISWRWQRLFKAIPAADEYHFEIAENYHDYQQNNADQSTLTWIGHATFLIQFAGINILTDPQFSNRASPVSWAGPKRAVPPGLKIAELPEIDAIIISHDHYDSLDLASVLALSKHNRQHPLTFIVPLGMKSWFDDLDLINIHVVELDWGQSHTLKGVTFTAEPSQHWGKRTLFDTNQRLWASWVITAKGNNIFFAGDTGYTSVFKDIGNKYGHFELALLPIGAYEPRWFMKDYHVNPEESVKLHIDIRSKHSVAMHWGTFILTDEPLDEPPVKLAQALLKYNIPETDFETYQHGEMRETGDFFE